MQTLTEPKLQNITLYFKEGSSDKVYQCQIEAAGERFTVNFSYGRRGSTLNTGTKTNVPVDYASAQRIFEKLVKEKRAKGYTEGQDAPRYQHTESKPAGLLPQLLNPVEESDVQKLIADDAWGMQEKLDGRRLILRKEGATIQGINKKGNLVGLPESLLKAVELYQGDLVIDGEMVGENYHAFDLLSLESVDVRHWPYRERLAALMNVLFSIQQRVHAPYTQGRPNSGGDQLKHKFVATLSAVVAKVNIQRSVELQLLEGAEWIYCGNVTIPANHKIPAAGQVVEIRYLYAFKESGVLFQPVYLGPREDVDADECTTAQRKFKPEEEADQLVLS